MHPKIIANALMFALLGMLSACSTPAPITQIEVVRIAPPLHWTTPIEHPEPRGDTIGYLVEEHRAEQKAALDACNVNLSEMRRWIEKRGETEPENTH